MAIGDRPGLQAERTDLSWVRTSASMIINGGLLIWRQGSNTPSTLQLMGGAMAVALALLALIVARRRRRVLMQRPLPAALAAPAAIVALALGTALLAISTLVALLFS